MAKRPPAEGKEGKRKAGQTHAQPTPDVREEENADLRGLHESIRSDDNGEPFSGPEFNARVARKAYELFERRGRQEGHDVEDWLEAERLVKEEILKKRER
jgi:hypothetical protein